MIDKQEHIFTYNHILRRDAPGIGLFRWQPRPRTCQDCKAEFTATSPLQKRCKPCQEKADKLCQYRNNLRARAKRKAERKRNVA